MIYGVWQTATIANAGTLSGVVDLGRDWEYAQMVFGTMTAANISLLVSPTNTTFYNLSSSGVCFNCLTGNFATEVLVGGYQWVKVNSTVAQGAARTITLRGCRE